MDLPDVLVLIILSHASPIETATTIPLICRRFCRLCGDHSIWKQYYFRLLQQTRTLSPREVEKLIKTMSALVIRSRKNPAGGKMKQKVIELYNRIFS